MKKQIKINWSCCWPDTTFEKLKERFFYNLDDKYEFVVSDDPDFIFVMFYSSDFSFLNNRKAVRIFYTHENIHPNFQQFDYCIGYNSNLSFGDRYYYYLSTAYTLKELLGKDLLFEEVSKESAKEILKSKTNFCDFIYNHDREDKKRKYYFDLLSQYKPVSNFGQVYNMEKVKRFVYDFNKKMSDQKTCKFSIIVESSEGSRGLITEKIFHSIYNGNIPIYFGEDNIEDIVNPKRFINAKKYSDEELLKLVKEIDEDDEKFINIITEPALKDKYFLQKMDKGLTEYFDHIFSQSREEAWRRPADNFFSMYLDDILEPCNKYYNNWFRKKKRRITKAIKRRLGYKVHEGF